MPSAPIDQTVGPATVTTFGADRIRIYRRFATDRDSLFKACFDAGLIRKWRNSSDATLTECEIALRPGGVARLAWDMGGGKTLGLTATFQDVEPPARTVRSEVWDNAPGEAILCTVLMIPLGDGTLMTTEYWYKSRELRDAALATNLARRTEAEYGRLDALLAG